MSSCTWNTTPEPIFGNDYLCHFIFIKDSVEVKNQISSLIQHKLSSTLEENAFTFSMFTSALACRHTVYSANMKDLSGSARGDWVSLWKRNWLYGASIERKRVDCESGASVSFATPKQYAAAGDRCVAWSPGCVNTGKIPWQSSQRISVNSHALDNFQFGS